MRGVILCNGNVKREVDLIARFREWLLSSNHEDPAVRDSRKVLMVTAAWRKDEYDEAHIRGALNAIGIPSRYEGGYDTNIQNLAIYHQFNGLRSREPELYREYHAKQELIKQVKLFYRRKNTGLVRLLRDQVQLFKQSFPEPLGAVLAYPVHAARKDLPTLSAERLQRHYWCEDIQTTLGSLIANDRKMVDICNDIDLYFHARAGVMQNPLYLETKRRLEERILGANSIFLFGGHVGVLYNRLNFFKLKGAFVEALRRGTNLYAVSAGTGVLCNSIILYDDYGERRPGAEFEFFENGFGIITTVQLFPHCMDRIKTDDPDNLAYLAHRFQSSRCVGLNEESYLLVEFDGEAGGPPRERFTSVGDKDAVYVFDPTGRKTALRMGERLGA